MDALRERLAAVPGVEAVSLTNGMPIGLAGWAQDEVRGADEPPRGDGHGVATSYAVVDGNYFSTVGMALLEGRLFDSRDTTASPEVILVNRTLARQRWPQGNPIGQRLRIAVSSPDCDSSK